MRRLPALLAAGLALAGCGLGAGEERRGGVELRITRDFGHELLAARRTASVRQGDTVMRLLRASRPRVETRYGGRFVQSIDGLAGQGPEGGRDWFFFVNGVESDVGAAEYALRPGDRVQWDYRAWRATMSIPAIVGAFPEPMVGGVKGKRLPVRVECEDDGARACATVERRLAGAGVRASSATLGSGGTQNVLRVVVARWPRARLVQAVRRLERGPEQTGVFARFRRDRLELLDAAGRTARTAPPGTGLVAALRPGPEELLWVVTAADGRGLDAAAASLSASRLRDAFAVAAGPAETLKLPLEGAR